MTTKFWPVVAISLFCNSGNAQDSVAPVIPTYAVQGSQAMSRARNDADMQRAVQRARETKVLKDSMVAYAPTQRYYPVTDQLKAMSLAANRPAPPASSPGRGLSADIPVKVVKAPASEIPEFERPSNPVQPRVEPTLVSEEAPELPPKRNGLLDRLFKREKEGPEGMNFSDTSQGGADQPPGPPPVDPAINAATNASVVAPHGQGIPEPPSFGSTAPSPPEPGIAMAGEVGTPPPPVTTEQETVAPIFQRRASAPASGEVAAATTSGAVVAPPGQGIPEPPSFGSTAPSPPEPGIAMTTESGTPPAPVTTEPEEVAPIFQRRAGASASGEMVAVKAESEANVDGVLVRLYEGDKVSVLSRNGSEVKIRLPDQRVGTINANVLTP